MDKKLVIFDMDGTLIDSMGYWRGLDREVAKRNGVDVIPEDIFVRTAVCTMEETATVFIEEVGIKGTVESISKEFYDMMEYHYKEHVEAKPGAVAYLEKLKKQGGRMAVASATPLYLLDVIAQKEGIAPYLEFMLSCVDVGVGKTQPKVFLTAAERLGGKPSEIAVFEDSLAALTTAKKAGFYTIAVADCENVNVWEEMKSLADEVIEDWRDYE